MNSYRWGNIAVAASAVFLAGVLSFAQSTASSETIPAITKQPVHKQPSASSKAVSGKSTKASDVAHRSSAKSAKNQATKNRRSRRSVAKKPKGQQKIDSSRTQEIQQALIREHYLNGEPSGSFDDATQQALRRYQAANGWQSKTVPDSRALIKLGLGPDHEHLLNPESAMTMPSPAHSVRSSTPANPTPASQENQQ